MLKLFLKKIANATTINKINLLDAYGRIKNIKKNSYFDNPYEHWIFDNIDFQKNNENFGGRYYTEGKAYLKNMRDFINKFWNKWGYQKKLLKTKQIFLEKKPSSKLKDKIFEYLKNKYNDEDLVKGYLVDENQFDKFEENYLKFKDNVDMSNLESEVNNLVSAMINAAPPFIKGDGKEIKKYIINRILKEKESEPIDFQEYTLQELIDPSKEGDFKSELKKLFNNKEFKENSINNPEKMEHNVSFFIKRHLKNKNIDVKNPEGLEAYILDLVAKKKIPPPAPTSSPVVPQQILQRIIPPPAPTSPPVVPPEIQRRRIPPPPPTSPPVVPQQILQAIQPNLVNAAVSNISSQNIGVSFTDLANFLDNTFGIPVTVATPTTPQQVVSTPVVLTQTTPIQTSIDLTLPLYADDYDVLISAMIRTIDTRVKKINRVNASEISKYIENIETKDIKNYLKLLNITKIDPSLVNLEELKYDLSAKILEKIITDELNPKIERAEKDLAKRKTPLARLSSTVVSFLNGSAKWLDDNVFKNFGEFSLKKITSGFRKLTPSFILKSWDKRDSKLQTVATAISLKNQLESIFESFAKQHNIKLKPEQLEQLSDNYLVEIQKKKNYFNSLKKTAGVVTIPQIITSVFSKPSIELVNKNLMALSK